MGHSQIEIQTMNAIVDISRSLKKIALLLEERLPVPANENPDQEWLGDPPVPYSPSE